MTEQQYWASQQKELVTRQTTLEGDFFDALERCVYDALCAYANVHRGSGHASVISTQLFEQARNVVRDYLKVDSKQYVVIFCSPRRADSLVSQLEAKQFKMISSADIGLPVGVCAVAVEKSALGKLSSVDSGGGSAKLMSTKWVVWAKAPERFEAGTPAIINIIAFACALRLLSGLGKQRVLPDKANAQPLEEILNRDTLLGCEGSDLLMELRKTRIGRNWMVPTMMGNQPYINLDNSASTPTYELIWDAFRNTWRQLPQNQKRVVDAVPNICAQLLNAPQATYDFIFTSNTTEAINLAAQNIAAKRCIDEQPVILTTQLEHSSNDLPWRGLSGHSVIHLSVNNEGFIQLDELAELLDNYNIKKKHGPKRIKLVAISGASNVLGTCNDLQEISQLVHDNGALLLVDAAQLVAHRKIDMVATNIDFLAFSAHKVYAPFGTGVLVARKEYVFLDELKLAKIKAFGQENTAGIAALGKALLLVQRIGIHNIENKEQELMIHALGRLKNISGLRLYGFDDLSELNLLKKVGVIAFDVKAAMSDKIANELALQRGVGIRSGCHCAHIIVKQVLHMGWGLTRFQYAIQKIFPKVAFPGVARMSFGIENTIEEVDCAIDVLEQIASRRQGAKDFAVSKDVAEQQMNQLSADMVNRVFSSPSSKKICNYSAV